MTKILLVSDTRIPTHKDTPQHGLGHCVLSYGEGLFYRDFEIEILAAPGSDAYYASSMHEADSETQYISEYTEVFYKDFDVIVDFSHTKPIAKAYPHLPVLDFSVDRESKPVSNPVFNSKAHMDYWHMKGEVVPSGINTELYSFNRKGKGYALFLAPMYPQKGFKTALFAAKESGVPFVFAGPGTEYIRGGRGAVVGNEKIKLMQEASVLFFPSPHEAGPRTVLESMACGTPVLCYNYGGAGEYVENGKSGIAVETQEDFIEAIPAAMRIDRKMCRNHVVRNYSEEVVIDKFENVINLILGGHRWNGYN